MKISVVTVCFNARETIEDTIKSVAEQTYDNIEYIIIDGASKDGTQDIILQHGNIVTKFISEPDKGLYEAMNKGLRMATGDFIGFLNADDYFTSPDSLEKIADKAICTKADCILADTVIISRDHKRIIRFYSGQNFEPWQFRFGHMPPHPSTYIKRDLLLHLGGFDTSYSISADFDLLLRLYKKLKPKVAVIPKTLVAMRSGGLSNSGIKGNILINHQVLQSCKKQGVWSNPAIIWSKYLIKLLQYVKRPLDYQLPK